MSHDPPRMPSALDVARRMTGMPQEREAAPEELVRATRRPRKKGKFNAKAAEGSGSVMMDYIARREREKAAAQPQRSALADNVKVEAVDVPHRGTHGQLDFTYDQFGPHTAADNEPLLTKADAMEAARRVQATGDFGSCVLQGRRRDVDGVVTERWMVRACKAKEYGEYVHFPLMPEES